MTPGRNLAPLTSAAAVLRNSSTSSGSSVALDTLPHVVSLISSFLDFATPARWSIERACERGLGLRMLRRLAAHEASEGLATDPFYRAYLASKGLVAAIRRSSDDAGDGDDNLEIVRWMCCEYCPHVVPVKVMVEAAKCDRLRILQYLFERYPSVHPSEGMMKEVVKSGALSVLQFLISRAKETYLSVEGVDRLLRKVINYGGKPEMVQWLLHERRNLTGDKTLVNDPALLARAIERGHFEVVRFLVEQGYQLDSSMQVGRVRRCGDLETVKWLHTQQLTSSKVRWIDLAANAGDLSVIKWVHENIPDDICSTKAMTNAAKNGHLEIVQWLHANRTEGCTTYAMDNAAQNGHLEIIQWLHGNRIEGCTTRAMDYAARNDHLDVVKWLHVNRPEGCTAEAMNSAAYFGHLHVIKWLHENRTEGCTTTAMNEAKSVEVLQWLHEHRSEGCTENAMVNGAYSGNFEVLMYLKEHQLDVGIDERVVEHTFWNSNFEIFEWLYASYRGTSPRKLRRDD